MRCTCGYTMPQGTLASCPLCGDLLKGDVEDYLGDPSWGLVKEIRQGQLRLAGAIDTALRGSSNSMSILQGGTGLGKSLAYLVPALLSGRRIVVSTACKQLQEQLAQKDVPNLQKVLGLPRSFASVKGKASYICALQLDKNEAEFKTTEEKDLLKRIRAFLKKSKTGEFQDIEGEMPRILQECTADDCIGKKRCKRAGSCGYIASRAGLRDVELVITNHSLLGYDLRFTPGTVFGPYEVLIMDEAHSAIDMIRGAFSQHIAYWWYLKKYVGTLLKEAIPFSININQFYKEWDNLFNAVPKPNLGQTACMLEPGFFGPTLLPTIEQMDTLGKDLMFHLVQTYGASVTDSVTQKQVTPDTLFSNITFTAPPDAMFTDNKEYAEFQTLSRLLDKYKELRDSLLGTSSPESPFLNLRINHRKGPWFNIDRQPQRLGKLVGPRLHSIPHVIMASATMPFTLIEQELGVTPTQKLIEASPFPYDTHAMIYISKSVPPPPKAGDDKKLKETYLWEMTREIVDLVEASRGDALVLFTSFEDLVTVKKLIDDNYDVKYPIVCQQQGQRPEPVFREYLATPNSIIFGSRSFYEGVDVQGPKLKLVILSKLPFMSPTDPQSIAKEKELGGRSFAEFSVPKMITCLQQIAGRLIRTCNDKGVFAVLDSRIWSGPGKSNEARDIKAMKDAQGNIYWYNEKTKRRLQHYGVQVFRALPFSNVTGDLTKAQKFVSFC